MKAGSVLLSLKTMEILGRRRVTSLGGSCSYLEHKGWLGQSSGFLHCWLQHIHICLGLTPHCSLFAELLYTNKMKQTIQVMANLVIKPTASEKKAMPHAFKVSSWINISSCSLDPQGTSTQPKVPSLLLETCEIDCCYFSNVQGTSY